MASTYSRFVRHLGCVTLCLVLLFAIAIQPVAAQRGGGDRGGDASRGGGPPAGGGPSAGAAQRGGPPGAGGQPMWGGGPPMMGGGGPAAGGQPTRGGGPPMMGGGGPAAGGQPTRGGGPPMMGGGGPAPAGGGMSNDRLAEMLRAADANGDGKLELSEIPEYRREFVKAMLDRMGLDSSKPIAIDSIRERVNERAGGSPAATNPRSQENRDPLVPGFGVTQSATTPVPAFGVRVEEPKPVTFAIGGGTGGDSTLDTARSFIARYDRNRNGVIDADETEGMRPSARELDRNRDGRITLDEVAQYLRGTTAARSGAQRDSYRFSTMQEILPEGVPQWFLALDTNGDGQVSMAEYASDWTPARIEEFQWWDINQDGLITAQECVDATREARAAGYRVGYPEAPPAGSGASAAGANAPAAGSAGGSSATNAGRPAATPAPRGTTPAPATTSAPRNVAPAPTGRAGGRSR